MLLLFFIIIKSNCTNQKQKLTETSIQFFLNPKNKKKDFHVNNFVVSINID